MGYDDARRMCAMYALLRFEHYWRWSVSKQCSSVESKEGGGGGEGSSAGGREGLNIWTRLNPRHDAGTQLHGEGLPGSRAVYSHTHTHTHTLKHTLKHTLITRARARWF